MCYMSAPNGLHNRVFATGAFSKSSLFVSAACRERRGSPNPRDIQPDAVGASNQDRSDIGAYDRGVSSDTHTITNR